MPYLRRLSVLLVVLLVVNLLGVLAFSAPVAADTNLPIGGQAQVYYTDGDGVRIREGSSVDSDTLKVLEEGWRVTVHHGPITGDDSAIWYKVSHAGSTGYILAQYLTTATGETGGLMPGESAAIFTDDGAPLRLRDAVEGEVLLTMPHGGVALVLDGPTTDSQNRRWYQVKFDGTTGWALGGYLRPVEYVAASRETTSRSGSRSAPEATPAPAAPKPQPTPAPAAPAPQPAPRSAGGGNGAMASLAREYIGAPYVFGGTTPAGFDCSGFVRYIASRALGISLGRDVNAQYGAGVAVSADDLRPGDLVFQKNTYRWGLSHVGIYIGNGQMISAQSESTGVRIQYLWDSYWGPRYYGARRL
ncbi:MAG: C40 family peptidase [Chloroflexi bacterium]|nr:C40 family peptidase [Chloroflexota bacterium]